MRHIFVAHFEHGRRGIVALDVEQSGERLRVVYAVEVREAQSVQVDTVEVGAQKAVRQLAVAALHELQRGVDKVHAHRLVHQVPQRLQFEVHHAQFVASSGVLLVSDAGQPRHDVVGRNLRRASQSLDVASDGLVPHGVTTRHAQGHAVVLFRRRFQLQFIVALFVREASHRVVHLLLHLLVRVDLLALVHREGVAQPASQVGLHHHVRAVLEQDFRHGIGAGLSRERLGFAVSLLKSIGERQQPLLSQVVQRAGVDDACRHGLDHGTVAIVLRVVGIPGA